MKTCETNDKNTRRRKEKNGYEMVKHEKIGTQNVLVLRQKKNFLLFVCVEESCAKDKITIIIASWNFQKKRQQQQKKAQQFPIYCAHCTRTHTKLSNDVY